MKNADLALYRAKADGGGVYRFFEAEMDARMQARRVIELDLRKAIKNGEFELLYQPIVDVKSGQITSCEALVRWHHPERGTSSCPSISFGSPKRPGSSFHWENGCSGRLAPKPRTGRRTSSSR